ncbi:MAG: hypothetical protein LBC83_01055 [Oscillospiraceae bacterium]|jgi:hypothetical protein|nr:hypothetical protein [Oscillospiraceae bacterium]
MKRTKWTKKATLLLAAVCLIFVSVQGAVAPQAAGDWLLQVDGLPVYRELYAYFLTEALLDPAYAEAGADEVSREALRKEVTARCVAFVAINSELRNRWQVLGQQYKLQAAERTGFLWRTFGDYYSTLGISKQTLALVQTGKANEKQLFLAIYDAGGVRAVPEQQIKDAYYRGHAAYEGLRVFRTVVETAADGVTARERPMTAEESAALKGKLDVIAAEISAGKDFFAACEEHAETLSYAAAGSAEIRKSDPDFTEAEFESIRQLSPSAVRVLEFPGFYLLARGVDMGESPEEYYLLGREETLWEMRGAEYRSLLSDLKSSYHAEENVAAAKALLDAWEWKSNAKDAG